MNDDTKAREQYLQNWESVNRQLKKLLDELEDFKPSTRESALAKTKVEEAFLWWQSERGLV